MSLLRIQGYYPRFKVITADPKLFLRIKSYYSGSKVIIQDPKLLRRIQRFYFRSNPIQNLDTGIWRRDIQFTFQHGGCLRWEVEEVPFPSFLSLDLFHRSNHLHKFSPAPALSLDAISSFSLSCDKFVLSRDNLNFSFIALWID